MKLFKLSSGQMIGLLTAILLLLSIAVTCAYFGIFQPAQENAEKIGAAAGGSLGSVVGGAVGSYNGISEGWQSGKEEGLRAEDTHADMNDSIREVGKLEVLCAAVGLRNEHKIGDDYARLEILLGDAVFTVDLSLASITEPSAQELTISLPSPEMTLYFDESKTQKLADYQAVLLDGSAEDGFDAAFNSRKKVFEEANETITNYETLMEQAKASAVKNVELLARQISMGEKTVHIEFSEEADAN